MSKKDLSMLEKTIQECDAMLRYARAHGKHIKPELQSAIEQIKIQQEQVIHETNRRKQVAVTEAKRALELAGKDPNSIPESELVQNASAPRTVKSFVEPLEKGMPSEEEMVKELGKVHQDLSAAVYPALPSAILVLEEGQQSSLRFLGPVPLVRRMMILTIVCLVGFLTLFITPYVDSKSVSTDILGMDDWLEFLFNESVIIFAAALGACFYALFEAYKYVSNGSYDPRYESIYWIRFTLGIVSGIILSQFIFQPGMDIETLRAKEYLMDILQKEEYVKALQNKTGINILGDNNGAGVPNMQGLFTYSPLLSFLGGFSARVVHKILNSLVDSVESFISGSARDLIRAREESAKAQLEDKINGMKQQAAAKDAANKMMSALQLMQLQQKVGAGQLSNEQIKAQLDSMMNALVTPVGGQSMFTVPPTVPQANPQVNTNPNPMVETLPADNPPVNNTVTPPVNNEQQPPTKPDGREFNPEDMFADIPNANNEEAPPTSPAAEEHHENPFADVMPNHEENPFGDIQNDTPAGDDNPFGDVPPNDNINKQV